MERCSSGLRGTPGKRVYSKRVSGVRISFSPQTGKENQRQVHLNADFLFRFAPPRRRRREMSERQRTKSRREGGAQDHLREMSERQRTESRREGGARDRLREISERQRTKSPREGGAHGHLREMLGRQRRNLREKEARGAAYGRCRNDSDKISERRRRAGRLRTRPVISDNDLLNHRR